ncbi:MAG: hypothetical protein LW806_02205 [Planctomycetaceae bacterium]|nr:hypothetical protein [Planctomycetaceae bacterium]
MTSAAGHRLQREPPGSIAADMPPEAIMFIVVTIGVVGLAVALFLLHRRAERARTEAMRAWSERIGLGFTEQDDSLAIARENGTFPLFGAGRSQKLRNLCSGEVEIADMRASLVCGDLDYTVGSGKQARRIRTTFILLVPTFRMTAMLDIRPENWFDKAKALAGFNDIDFPDEEFSRRFHVTCSDPAFAVELLGGGLTRHFLEKRPLLAAPPMLAWHPKGLLLWSPKRWEPAALDDAIDWMSGFLSGIPEELRRRSTAADGGDAGDA